MTKLRLTCRTALLLCGSLSIAIAAATPPEKPATPDTTVKQSARSPVSDADWAVYLDAFKTKLRQEGFTELVFENRKGPALSDTFTLQRSAECAVVIIGTDSGLTATIRQPDGSSGNLGNTTAYNDVYSIIASNRANAGTYSVAARGNGRIALLVGTQKMSGTDAWSAMYDVVRGEFGKNGYRVVTDTSVYASQLSVRFTMPPPQNDLFMGWAVVSNNNSISASVIGPDGRTTRLGGGSFSNGFYINMDFAPATIGNYQLTAKTAGGSGDRILVVIGYTSGNRESEYRSQKSE